jgi:hypothetical protein
MSVCRIRSGTDGRVKKCIGDGILALYTPSNKMIFPYVNVRDIYLCSSLIFKKVHGYYTGFHGFLRFSLFNSRFFLRLFPFPETAESPLIAYLCAHLRVTCALTRNVRPLDVSTT